MDPNTSMDVLLPLPKTVFKDLVVATMKTQRIMLRQDISQALCKIVEKHGYVLVFKLRCHMSLDSIDLPMVQYFHVTKLNRY